jgi:dTDP-4-amino-4,6-dideoxygalactose transaminase
VRYHNEVPGYNSRLDELQAALLRVKLRKLDDWNERRAKLAHLYLNYLSSSKCTLPFVPDWADPVWHLFVIRNRHRDRLQKRLTEEGVQTIIHYPIPPHLSGAYTSSGFGRGHFPIAEDMAADVLSLPISPHLTNRQLEHVIHSLLRSVE